MGTSASKRRRLAAANMAALQAAVDVTGQQGEKGMLNSLGLHHCFLNVVIQSLWHVHAFRERFIRLPHHHHKQTGLTHDYVGVEAKQSPASSHNQQEADADGDAMLVESEDGCAPPSPDVSHVDDESTCVCCALKLIFIYYEHSDASILPPDSLRYALSLLTDNRGSHKFALREMSDAEEALDEILKFLHLDHIGAANVPPPKSVAAGAPEESELSRSLDVTCVPPCISHKVFGSQIMDQRVCWAQGCGATSDPEISSSFLYRVYVNEMVSMKRQQKQWSFEQLLRLSYLQQDFSCPSPEKSVRGPQGQPVTVQCPGKAKIDRWLLQLPETFAMMCVWANPESEREQIADFFALIPREVHIDRFLKVSTPSQQGGTAQYEYVFRGMILYYGRHYVAVFHSAQFQSYCMFDDKRVTRLGDWPAVVDRCVRGKLQPTVLFYESADPAVAQRLELEMQQSDEAERVAHEQAVAKNKALQPLAAVTGPTAVAARPAAPAVPPSAAAAVLSPTTAATNDFFRTNAPASAHIIPAPARESPPAAASSSSSSVAASFRAPAPIPPARSVRSPPGLIEGYFPPQPASSDDDDWDRFWHETSQAADLQTQTVHSPDSAVLQPPSVQRTPSYGFASPSPARDLHLRRLGHAFNWCCTGCGSWYASTAVPHGQCPRCAERLAAAAQATPKRPFGSMR